VTWTPRPVPPARGWVVAKWSVLAVTAAFLPALLLHPELGTRVFWFAVVPVLPALFLVNAELWRNVCPLATLGSLWERPEVRPLTRTWATRSTVIGLVLFAVLVPARPTLFDGSGAATATLIASAALIAFLGGLVFERKAGFCNSVCPILPVERLYGQRPLVAVSNARCAPCRACTHGPCFDLNPQRSALVSLRPAGLRGSWVTAPFGAFALALPGFIFAYSLTSGGSEPPGVAAYVTMAGGAGLSWVLLGAVFTLRSSPPSRALLFSAALAVGLYYWFTPAAVARAWSLPEPSVVFLRAALLGLVAVWTARSLFRPAPLFAESRPTTIPSDP
jgi:nitrite reductase (NADH) large subunit